MADFDSWARYYDLIHKGLPGEAEFYVGNAVRLGGKTLELGCGTGRIAIAMAMSGAHATGLDNSQRMLEVCREKLRAVEPTPGSLRLVHADMSDFDLGETFDLIAMPYRTFMHLHRPEQQRRCLRLVHKHLKDDGLFILNTWMPKATVIAANTPKGAAEPLESVDEYPLPETGGELRHFHRATFDETRQRIVEEHLLEEVDAHGAVIASTTLPLVRVWTTRREMDNLVRLCGFQVDALFGDFDCGPLTPASTEMIWVLKKQPIAS